MSEPKPIYDAETVDALEMLGKGYDQEYIRKELPAVMSGFTPAPDVLITEFGFVTALVWGKVWRYCQMSDGICRAKLETLAGQLGMSVRTIIRHIDPLVEGGYLKDVTPDLKNRPHIYADTGKVRIKISVEATMTKSHSTMTESHSHHDRESLEESKGRKNKEIIQEANQKVDAILSFERKAQGINTATISFESSFGFGALPWGGKPEWVKFEKWVNETFASDPNAFVDYVKWRKDEGKYKGAMTNTAIRRDPQMFIDTGYPTFLADTAIGWQRGKVAQQEKPKAFPTLVNGRVER